MHLCRFPCLRGLDRLGYVAGRSATRTRRLCGGGNMCCVEKYAAQTAADERSANSIFARVHRLDTAVSGGNMCCVEKYAAQTAADERSANLILVRVHGLHAAVSGGARKSSTHSAQRSSRGMVCGCFACTASHIMQTTINRGHRRCARGFEPFVFFAQNWMRA